MRWLEELYPGNFVIVSGRTRYLDRIRKVERLTKTQIILEGGGRYRRKDGCMVGESAWVTHSLEECTEERLSFILHTRKVNKILKEVHRSNLEALSTEKLTAILELLP